MRCLSFTEVPVSEFRVLGGLQEEAQEGEGRDTGFRYAIGPRAQRYPFSGGRASKRGLLIVNRITKGQRAFKAE